jgi:hypothetical protein
MNTNEFYEGKPKTLYHIIRKNSFSSIVCFRFTKDCTVSTIFCFKMHLCPGHAFVLEDANNKTCKLWQESDRSIQLRTLRHIKLQR